MKKNFILSTLFFLFLISGNILANDKKIIEPVTPSSNNNDCWGTLTYLGGDSLSIKLNEEEHFLDFEFSSTGCSGLYVSITEGLDWISLDKVNTGYSLLSFTIKVDPNTNSLYRPTTVYIKNGEGKTKGAFHIHQDAALVPCTVQVNYGGTELLSNIGVTSSEQDVTIDLVTQTGDCSGLYAQIDSNPSWIFEKSKINTLQSNTTAITFSLDPNDSSFGRNATISIYTNEGAFLDSIDINQEGKYYDDSGPGNVPVEENPVEENPVEENPVEENPVEENPVEENPVEENPVEENPVEDVCSGKFIYNNNETEVIELSKDVQHNVTVTFVEDNAFCSGLVITTSADHVNSFSATQTTDGRYTITFSIPSNRTAENRYAFIRVKNNNKEIAKLTVKQEKDENATKCEGEIYYNDSSTSSIKVDYTVTELRPILVHDNSNDCFNLTPDKYASWVLDVSLEEATDDSYYINIFLEKNNTTRDRSTFIYIRQSDGVKIDYIILTQKAAPREYDDDYNWVRSETYDITGKIIGAGKSYFDDLGKGTQSHTYNVKTGKVWVSETMYDSQGRAALQTMSAPVRSFSYGFNYEDDLIKNSRRRDFTSDDFEGENLENPSTVSSSVDDSIGEYYSDDGPDFQDTTDRPYARTIYSELNPGAVKKTIGGNKTDTNGDGDIDDDDQWQQGYSFTIPAAQEMYYVYGYDYFPNDIENIHEYIEWNSNYEEYNDQDDAQEALYTLIELDNNDCFVKGDTLDPYSLKVYSVKTNHELGSGQVYKLGDKLVQIFVKGNPFFIAVNNSETLRAKIGDNCEEYIAYNTYLSENENLEQIIDNQAKKVNWLRATKTVVQDIHGNESVVFTDADGKTLGAARSGTPDNSIDEKQYEVLSLIGEQKFVDIHIPKGCREKLSFVGSTSIEYKIFDLKTEAEVSVLELQKGTGFYRLEYIGDKVFTKVSNLTYLDASGSNVTIEPVESDAVGVRYNVNYYDFSLNYYNDIGQLTASLQPLGFVNSCLNGLSPTVTHKENLKSTFEYDALGQLVSTTSPDEGEARFKYREDGQIRFSQNAKQAKVNEFSYTIYDDLARPIESGVAEGTFDSLDPDIQVFEFLNRKDVHHTVYDVLYSTSVLDNLSYDWSAGLRYHLLKNNFDHYYREPKFLAGNVAMTYNTGEDQNDLISRTYYSYDIYGRVQWIMQYIPSLGDSPLTQVKTIDYEYDYVTSQVTKVIYQKDTPNERFIHRYTYDDDSQELIKVETSTNGTDYTTHADYEYYETGALKRTILADGIQGIDYVYNLAGQLKAINHPDLTASSDPGGDSNDLFGVTLDYYDGDYQRDSVFTKFATGDNQYNGNIKSMTWNTLMDDSASNPYSYSYSYNRNNWLTAATFNDYDNQQLGAPSTLTLNKTINSNKNVKATERIHLDPGFFMEATNTAGFNSEIDPEATGGEAYGEDDYNVSNLTYDQNGNILSLHRNKNTEEGLGNRMDELTYHYKTDKPNQLLRVEDDVTHETNADDIKNQEGDPNSDIEGENYKYNEIGQLTENYKEYVRYEYNASGLVTKVYYDDALKVEFVYNDKNFRTRKISYGNEGETTTDYIRDVAGSVLAIYENEHLVELPIYGASRLGIHKKVTGTDVYQLTDHLGNVRAVIAKDETGNAAAITSATDYYPFGMPMPNRKIVNGEPYRYGYQGEFAETDSETGKPAFELRLYDPRIGRWLSPDPKHEFHSPYLAMANNPANVVDPDGGCTDCPENVEDGHPYYHQDLGQLTYDASSGYWKDEAGFNIMDDVFVGGSNNLDNISVQQAGFVSSFDFSNLNLPQRGNNADSFDKLFNNYNAGLSTVMTTFEAFAQQHKKELINRGTLTAAKKIKKFVDPAIEKFGKVSSKLGWTGTIYNTFTFGYDILSGKPITASKVFDTVVGIGLSFVATSNPIGLVGLGAYGLLDAYGALDGVKSYFGGDKVIINGN